MGIVRGDVKDVLNSDLQKEAFKVLVLFDLIVFAVLGTFVYLYIQMTPFSKAFVGAVTFISFVVISIAFFFMFDQLGNKYKWYVFSRFNDFNKMRNVFGYEKLDKLLLWNNRFLISCFVVVWVHVLLHSPTNLYWAEFKPNATTWIDQGKCDEIKKYNETVANFCFYDVAKTKENTKGVFIVESKRLTSDATGCTYMVNSDKNSMYFITTKAQPCDVVVGQKVNVELKSFAAQESLVEGSDLYSYSLKVVPVN